MYVELKKKVKLDVDNFTFCFENKQFLKYSCYFVILLKDEQIKKEKCFQIILYADDFKV